VNIKVDKAGKRGHVFSCSKAACRITVVHWLDKGDSRSTSNLRKHVRKCWGPEVLAAAEGMRETETRTALAAFVRSGSIQAAFASQTVTGIQSYLVRQHTRAELRYV
jgi:hypothetical protein